MPTPCTGPATLPGPSERLADERELFSCYRRNQSPAVREELVERLAPLARSLALRYWRGREPLEDLVQVANLGLLKAIRRFDPGRGNAFTSFAVPTILGELKRHFRDRGWAIQVGRALKERAVRVQAAEAELAGRLGHPPSDTELGQHLNLSGDEVREAREATNLQSVLSLDAAQSGEMPTFEENVGGPDPAYDLVEYATSARSAIDDMSPRDRMVVRLRFGQDLTQREIAGRVGVSQMQVSRILRRVATRFRREIAEA